MVSQSCQERRVSLRSSFALPETKKAFFITKLISKRRSVTVRKVDKDHNPEISWTTLFHSFRMDPRTQTPNLFWQKMFSLNHQPFSAVSPLYRAILTGDMETCRDPLLWHKLMSQRYDLLSFQVPPKTPRVTLPGKPHTLIAWLPLIGSIQIQFKFIRSRHT